jgi:hypothetical protein
VAVRQSSFTDRSPTRGLSVNVGVKVRGVAQHPERRGCTPILHVVDTVQVRALPRLRAEGPGALRKAAASVWGTASQNRRRDSCTESYWMPK